MVYCRVWCGQYFNNMVDGIKPRSEPLILRRVIMNSIPRFGPAPSRNTPEPPDPDREGQPVTEVELGCCPYLQLFKGGYTRLVTKQGPVLMYRMDAMGLKRCG